MEINQNAIFFWNHYTDVIKRKYFSLELVTEINKNKFNFSNKNIIISEGNNEVKIENYLSNENEF